jgi:hypothetical protein
MFAPPFGPSDLVGHTRGVYDDPLVGGTEGLGKTGQSGLDEPRFEDDPCGLAVTIEFLRHPQRLGDRYLRSLFTAGARMATLGT